MNGSINKVPGYLLKFKSGSSFSGLFILMVFLLFSCNQTANKTTSGKNQQDSLKYTYQIVKERASNCGTLPDSNCTVAQFSFPVFEPTLKKLADSIDRKLIILYDTEITASTLQQQAKKFVLDYEEFIKTDQQYRQTWTMDAKATVLRQDSSLITLAINGYSYAGGAHGSSGYFFVNWDIKKDESVKLDSILVDNYRSELNRIAEKIFRKNERLSDTTSLANQYFFKNNRFYLNVNFLITLHGLQFTYNQYEIKPYSDGITKLLVPYDQIKTLIRPNSILQQFILK